jgi:DNA-binding transcriptional LysR family regulator
MDRMKTMATFVKIARAASLSEAARTLGITRALASNHLRQLEDHLGVRLINRTTRQLSLTEAGADYLEFCMRMLQSLDDKDSEISQSQMLPRGHLKVVASAAFAEFVLAPITARFTETYPEIQLSLITGATPTSSHELVELGYDLGITMQRVEEVSMVIARLGAVHWRPYASASYIARRGAPLTPADLVQHDCLLHQRISPDRTWQFEGPDGHFDLKVTGPLFTNNVMVLREFVLAGRGIGLLPRYSAMSFVERSELTELLMDYTTVSRDIFAVYSSAKYLPKKVRLFLDFVRKELRGALDGRDDNAVA